MIYLFTNTVHIFVICHIESTLMNTVLKFLEWGWYKNVGESFSSALPGGSLFS